MKQIKEAFSFGVTGIRHLKDVGSLVPSSKTVNTRIASKIQQSPERLVIVEYGPGNGGLARLLLQQGILGPEDHLILIELLPDFAVDLHRMFAALQDDPTAPRVSVIRESAEHVADILAAHGEKAADYIISGIPFSTIGKEKGREIIASSAACLKENGAFIGYQVRGTLHDLLHEQFTEVTSRRVWRCLPPLLLSTARNPRERVLRSAGRTG